MAKRRKPNIFEWLVAMVLTVLGATLLWAHTLPGSTPESELTHVTGPMTDGNEAKVTRLRGVSKILNVNMGPYHFDYTNTDPEYDAVLKAVEDGTSVDAWVSTKTERAIFREAGRVRLYKLKIGDREVLTYEKSLNKNGGQNDNSTLTVGAVVLIMGLITLYSNYRNSQ